MKRKILILLTTSLAAISLVGCGTNNAGDDINNTSTNSSSSTGSYSSHSSSSSKTSTHYCQADSCSKEGVKTITGLSGATEYYCAKHYNEIQNIIGNMEKDVGKSSASKHKCEVCSKEGTRSLKGLSGATEYYCTKHYNEMVEIVNSMLKD